MRPGLDIAHPWREAILPVAPIYYICRTPFLSLCLFSFVGGLVYLNGGVCSCVSLTVSFRVKTIWQQGPKVSLWSGAVRKSSLIDRQLFLNSMNVSLLWEIWRSRAKLKPTDYFPVQDGVAFDCVAQSSVRGQELFVSLLSKKDPQAL